MAIDWELAFQNSRSFWESSRWHLIWTCRLQRYTTLDSSVGRAVDCSCNCQTSIGRWFKSGSREYFFLSFSQRKPAFEQLDRQHCHQFLDSLVVRISACHVEGPGSIPGRGEFFPHMCDICPQGVNPFGLAKKSELARVAQSVER